MEEALQCLPPRSSSRRELLRLLINIEQDTLYLYKEMPNSLPLVDDNRSKLVSWYADALAEYVMEQDHPSRDLDKLVDLRKEFLGLHARDQSAHIQALSDLALALEQRFRVHCDVQDREAVIRLLKEASESADDEDGLRVEL